jgi:dihydroorotate dehydrogenase (fumarate)
MMTSAVLRHGPERITTAETDLRRWMDEHDYHSAAQMRGSASRANVADPSAFERANYLRTLHSWAAPAT